jgi:hypothetical protein
MECLINTFVEFIHSNWIICREFRHFWKKFLPKMPKLPAYYPIGMDKLNKRVDQAFHGYVYRDRPDYLSRYGLSLHIELGTAPRAGSPPQSRSFPQYVEKSDMKTLSLITQIDPATLPGARDCTKKVKSPA